MEKLIAENLNDLSVLNISGKYNVQVITQALEMEVAAFNLYNPNFENEVASQGYSMRLPQDKMKKFKEKRQDILNDSIEMLLKINTTVLSNDKSNYPEAIHLPKTKAIISTAGEQKVMRRK